jgi:hypothetical protein
MMGVRPEEKRRDQGHKADAGKLRYDLIPPRAEEMLAAVLTHGAERYGAGSWMLVHDARARYTAALMRHLAAWRKGERTDQDSGLPHMAHLLANAVFLLEIDAAQSAATELDEP